MSNSGRCDTCLAPTGYPPRGKLCDRCFDLTGSSWSIAFSRIFATQRRLPVCSATKTWWPLQSAFDLDASNNRILPLAGTNVDQSHLGWQREVVRREAALPPGGARLAAIHCQRYGRSLFVRRKPCSTSSTRLWRTSFRTAKHP